MDKKTQRKEKRLKSVAAAFRLLESSGRNELITTTQFVQITPPATDSNKLLKELKRRREAGIRPKFFIKSDRLRGDEERGRFVNLKDAHSFILCGVFGNNNSACRAYWCELTNWRHISQTIFVVVDSEEIPSKNDDFPFLFGNFLHYVDVKNDSTSSIDATSTFYDGLFSFEKSYADTVREAEEERAISNPQIPLEGPLTKIDLLLSPSAMIAEGYPLPKYAFDDRLSTDLRYEFSRATYSKTVCSTSPVYAVDCEMCLTSGNRSELTRISIVDEHYNVIYDTLVKPANPIVDYLTPFSGITPDMLKNVQTTLDDVQRFLGARLEPDAILCGHSLQFDLHAMRTFHPYVIDLSVVYNLSGQRRRKSGLQTLAYTFLDGRKIQQSAAGHCSIEDACATMMLLEKKLIDFAHDRHFGNVADGWNYFNFSKEDDDSTNVISKKRAKIEEIEKVDKKILCEICREKIVSNCRHENCLCRALKYDCCSRCSVEKNVKIFDAKNEMEAEIRVRELFPLISSISSSKMVTGKMSISNLLEKRKKKMLWIRNFENLEVEIPESKFVKKMHIFGKDEKEMNKNTVDEFASHMYQYDLNVLELQNIDKNSNADACLAKIFKYCAPKSLVCVLFFNRKIEENNRGRMYMKLKQ